jgi:hypothetical protein
LVNYKKTCLLPALKFISLHISLQAEDKKGFLKLKNLRFNKTAKGLVVFAIIAVMLVSVFAFLPKGNNTPDVPQNSDAPSASPNSTAQATINPTSGNFPGIFPPGMESPGPSSSPTPLHDPGVIESAQTMNSSVWRAVAANAWNYFRPETGVDPNTGLPRGGGTDAPNFTDWDLGTYIQAVITAQKIGLIGTDGAWNSSQRLEIVVNFLETRELNSTTGYPYWFYQAKDGKDFHANSDFAKTPVDGADTGRLFVALNNLRVYNSSLTSRINNIVLYGQNFNRSNYAALLPAIKSDSYSSNNIYSYYIDSGFASFWPNELSGVPDRILNNILSSGNFTYNGVWLPNAALLGDPLLCSVFELNNNNPQLMAITKQFYLAHEAYYNSTGNFRAFSEGGTNSDHWAYEWTVLPGNQTWVVLNENGALYNNKPIVYTKISMGFLAVYNTTFAKNMTVYLESNLNNPTSGYCEGVDESGSPLNGVGIQTNSMVLDAALYVLQRSP